MTLNERELNIFMMDHPSYRLLSQASEEDRETLLWAERKKFISLERFCGKVFYTQYHLKTAKLWKAKMS